MNSVTKMGGFRELNSSEIALVSGGHYNEEPNIEFQMALQTLSRMQKSELLRGLERAGALPSPLSGDGDGDIIVTGERPAPLDISLNPQGPLDAARDIIFDMLQDANEDTRQYLLNLLGAGLFDQQFLENQHAGIDDSGTNNQTTHDCETNAVGQAVTMINASTAFDGLQNRT